MAASLIACARRMHSISSAVFTTLAAPTTPPASTSSRSPKAARSGIVRSSTARRPGGNDVASRPASSSHSRSRPPWTCSLSTSGGTPSGYGVNNSGGAPSAVTTATRAPVRRPAGVCRRDDRPGRVPDHAGAGREHRTPCACICSTSVTLVAHPFHVEWGVELHAHSGSLYVRWRFGRGCGRPRAFRPAPSRASRRRRRASSQGIRRHPRSSRGPGPR